MKILYDYQIFYYQNYGGISRYFCELINHLKKNNNLSCIVALKYSNNKYLSKLSPFSRLKFGYHDLSEFCLGLNLRGKYTLHKILKKIGVIKDHNSLNRLCSLMAIKEGNYDIFHPTYYDPYFCEYLNGKPFVLTIYDMIYELFTSYFSNIQQIIQNKRLLAEKATAIIAISETTKKDIINLYGIPAQKIKVIYLGNSLSPSKNKRYLKLPQKYILYVGNRSNYKNFNFFIKSITPLLKEDKSLYVVCGGGNVFSNEELMLIDKLSIKDKVIYKSIDNDGTLAILYKQAVAFVFPSLYEGFGIPVLEAFSCGCPTILSNAGSLPEIAADAAEYFDPEEESSILQAIKSVLYNEEKRKELQKKGFERLKYFSWEKTASETKKLYESLLKK